MGEITDFVTLYVDDSDILEEASERIASDLLTNIRSNLWKGHGYDKGELYRDIQTRADFESDKIAWVTGWYTVEHGDYVTRGVRGKGLAKSGPIDFMGDGLEKTLEAYR